MTVFLCHPIRQEPPGPQWGNPFYINERFVYPDELTETGRLPEFFRQRLERAADGFNPERDFFTMTGDYLQLATFTALLAVRYPLFGLLTYDKRIQGYIWSQVNSGIAPKDAPMLGSTATHTGDLNAEDRKQGESPIHVRKGETLQQAFERAARKPVR